MPRHTIHAEVDLKTKVGLQKAAKEQKVSTSVIVRWALDAYLTARQSKEAVSA